MNANSLIQQIINSFVKKIFSIHIIEISKEILSFIILYLCFIVNKYLCLFVIIFYMLEVYNSIFAILNTFLKSDSKSNFCISLCLTIVIYTMFKIQNFLLPLWSLLLVYVVKNVDIVLTKISFVADKTTRVLLLLLSIIIISILFSLISNYNILHFILFNLLLGILVFFINKHIYNYFINYNNREVIFCWFYIIAICCVLNIFNMFGVINL